MLSLKRLFSSRRAASTRQPVRRPVQLRLEALEERYCPVSSIGASSLGSTISGGKFAQAGNVMTLSDATIPVGADTFAGHMKGQQIKIDANNNGNITAEFSAGTCDCNGQQTTFTPSNVYVTATLSGSYFKGAFQWKADGSDIPAEDMRGYGNFDGTIDGSGNVTVGFYTEVIVSGNRDAMTNKSLDYYTWTGGGTGKWSDKNAWQLADGSTPSSAPTSGEICIFDNSVSNSNCEVDGSYTPWAVILQKGYTGTLTIDAGDTLGVRYADNGMSTSSNNFTVSFGSSTSKLKFLPGDQELGSFTFNSGGAVELGSGAIIQVGRDSSGYTCKTSSPITIDSGAEMDIGQLAPSFQSSTLTLGDNNANINVNGILLVTQSGNTDITAGTTSAVLWVNTGGSAYFEDPAALKDLFPSTINVPLEVVGGSAYVGDPTYSANTSSAYFKFTGVDSTGYSVYMTGGNIKLTNASTLAVGKVYKQTGGTLTINDKQNESLIVVNSSDTSEKLQFYGGTVKFNESQGRMAWT